MRILLPILILIVHAMPTRCEELKVYILTGQSNSLGTTALEGDDWGPGTHQADEGTLLYWSNVAPDSGDPNNIVLYGDSDSHVTSLQVQQGDRNNPGFWGPEFGFARTMFEAGQRDLLIIKVSRGGGTNRYWLPDSGHMASHLLRNLDIALDGVQAAGHKFKIMGLMYSQGESNSDEDASLADANLWKLLDSVTTHLNDRYDGVAADMYTVVGEIASSRSNPNRIKTTELQKSAAEKSDRIGFVATHDLPVKGDGIHFGRSAKLEIGKRLAEALLNRSKNEAYNKRAAAAACETGE